MSEPGSDRRQWRDPPNIRIAMHKAAQLGRPPWSPSTTPSARGQTLRSPPQARGKRQKQMARAAASRGQFPRIQHLQWKQAKASAGPYRGYLCLYKSLDRLTRAPRTTGCNPERQDIHNCPKGLTILMTKCGQNQYGWHTYCVAQGYTTFSNKKSSIGSMEHFPCFFQALSRFGPVICSLVQCPFRQRDHQAIAKITLAQVRWAWMAPSHSWPLS